MISSMSSGRRVQRRDGAKRASSRAERQQCLLRVRNAGGKEVSWHRQRHAGNCRRLRVQQAIKRPPERPPAFGRKKPQVSIVAHSGATVERNAPVRGAQTKQAAVACRGTHRTAGIGTSAKSHTPFDTADADPDDEPPEYGSARRRCAASRNAHCGRSSSRPARWCGFYR